MFPLTKQERLVLVTLGIVLLLGTVFHYAFKKNPSLKDIVNVMDSQKIYPKVDINQVSSEQLIKIPYIGPVTAGNIISYRNKHGTFKSWEELKSVDGMDEERFSRIFPFLKELHSEKRYEEL